ncbi:MAG TPA: hypothetical protein VF173_10565 [Thermoanaerobaculia bacterium]|nr:hypothetical protein [Thermoanaerobaculia bacterium]
MPLKITISIDKPGVLPGRVLLEDAGSLSSGLHDSLARLIQRQLGFPWRANLRNEAKRLTRVALTGVSEGSGVLIYEGLPTPDVTGRHPSAIAAFDLVTGIRAFTDSQAWPAYLPPVVRNRMGSAIATAISNDDDLIVIAVEEDGLKAQCEISQRVKEAMQATEVFAPNEPVEVVGKIVELDKRSLSFKLETPSRTLTIEVSEWQFRKVDSDLRWERVYVAGFPRDSKCRTIHNVTDLRPAAVEEEDGFNLTDELRRGEKTETYQQVQTRANELLALDDGWNTYGARSPGKRAVFFALHFLRDAIGVLLDHGITVPPPFLVPTASGGVQLEWSIDSRELELEIPEKGRFEFLLVDGSKEVEGEASRWIAMRLLRWVVTGEDV